MESPVFTLAGMRQFHNWTHASLTLVLDHLARIPTTDYTKELPSFGFPSLRAQVIHIFNCEAFWIHTLQKLQLQREVGLRTLNYLSRLSEQHLNGNAQMHFPDGDTAVRAPALILHHILTHAFHHKGQIVAMCRALGRPAPDTDLNNFE